MAGYLKNSGVVDIGEYEYLNNFIFAKKNMRKKYYKITFLKNYKEQRIKRKIY